LLVEVLVTSSTLGREWVTVAWRPTLYHVGDKDIFTVEVNGLKELFQELPCLAHKWASLLVLMISRGLTNKHDPGCLRAFTRDSIGASRSQRTLSTHENFLCHFIDAVHRRRPPTGQKLSEGLAMERHERY
jgi:hypothetical protein